MADVAPPETVIEAIAAAKERFGTPVVLFYNVGITAPDSALSEGEKNADLLVGRYRVDVAGAYHAIQQVPGPEFGEKDGASCLSARRQPRARRAQSRPSPRPGRRASRGRWA